MNTKWFSPELRTASVVPRWSIVWTQTRDVLSNHSFFVALYVQQIAMLIRWEHRTTFDGPLMFLALVHDLDETITGDIVAPAKREILDSDRAEEYVKRQMGLRLPYIVEMVQKCHGQNPDAFQQAKLIVKAADRLDALLYLTVEQRLGNSVIAPRIPECWASFEEAWFKLPGHPETLRLTWNDVVKPAVEAHRITGGYGI